MSEGKDPFWKLRKQNNNKRILLASVLGSALIFSTIAPILGIPVLPSSQLLPVAVAQQEGKETQDVPDASELAAMEDAKAMTGEGGEEFQVEEATIEDIHNAIKSGELTATELVHMYLERIKAYNGVCVEEPEGILGPVITIPDAGQLNALSTLNLRPEAREAWGFDERKARSMTDPVDDDPNMPDALEVAAALDEHFAETGELVGPLHGVVFSIKDAYDTFDMRTTSGADPFYANDRPPNDANFVKKLREAGAIILAKANLSEYQDGQPRSSFGGTFCNPYDTEREAGISSTGSGTSVAANLVTCSFAEETGSSIRGPAKAASSVGLSPTRELVSADGMIQQGWNTRVGPICRTVEDVARVLDAYAGFDPADEMTAFSINRMPSESYANFTKVGEEGLEGMRIGVVREYMDKELFTVADNETIDIIDQAVDDLEALGATIVDPGEGGALFQECVDRVAPTWRNQLYVAQFPDLFPVDASGNATTDHIPLLVDMKLDPSLVEHTSTGQPSVRNIGPAPNSGDAKFNFNWYLQERGDANIQSLTDLIEKANHYVDTPYMPGRIPSLNNSNSQLTLDNTNTMANRFAMQQVIFLCFAELDLDAVTYPTGNIPNRIMTNPPEPNKNDRGNIWTQINARGFPAMTVPAGFTTHVYDREWNPADPTNSTASILVGPIPKELPVGIDFLGLPFDEPTLFKIAAAYEAATHHRRPPPDFSGPLPGDSLPIEHMPAPTASAGYGVYSQKPARVEYVTNSSELVGDKIDSITLTMKRVGTINGTAEIGILNEDLSVKKLFGTLNVTDLTQTYTAYEFKLADELYTIEAGDRIGITYTGGSLESTSWISVMLDLEPEDPFDGANSYLQYHYQGAWRNSLDRDLYMVLMQTEDDDNGTPPPPEPTTFTAQLTGDEEVPPSGSDATGSAAFTLDGDSMQYTLNVTNIYNVTAAHIHVAPAGVNGPVVVPLFSGNATGLVDGVLAEGTITADDLAGPLAGMTMDDLVAEIDSGNTYVNVHTSAFPGGEIRGQIS
jgi:Asp-tRNA(Asn)/Glu-tRNA(Gln) amidotransferase A subunit family amidase